MIRSYLKNCNSLQIKKFASIRTYSARRTAWYSDSTDVDRTVECCRPYTEKRFVIVFCVHGEISVSIFYSIAGFIRLTIQHLEFICNELAYRSIGCRLFQRVYGWQCSLNYTRSTSVEAPHHAYSAPYRWSANKVNICIFNLWYDRTLNLFKMISCFASV